MNAKKFETLMRPARCATCTFSSPYSIKSCELVYRCEVTDELNYDSWNTVLEDCPLKPAGDSEEEYHCVRSNV